MPSTIVISVTTTIDIPEFEIRPRDASTEAGGSAQFNCSVVNLNNLTVLFTWKAGKELLFHVSNKF